MNTKFKIGEKCLVGEKEIVIRTIRKDFTTKQIIYIDNNMRKYNESQLSKISKEKEEKKIDPKIIEAREKYLEVIGKEVPAAFKNRIDWIQSKIDKKIASKKESE